MKKYLFYLMKEETMCVLHALMNAKDLHDEGHTVKIIFEGKAVKVPKALEEDKNELYRKLKNDGVIVGACKACSKMMGVLEDNEKLGLKLLDDMNGHAGMKPYVEESYEIISM